MACSRQLSFRRTSYVPVQAVRCHIQSLASEIRQICFTLKTILELDPNPERLKRLHGDHVVKHRFNTGLLPRVPGMEMGRPVVTPIHLDRDAENSLSFGNLPCTAEEEIVGSYKTAGQAGRIRGAGERPVLTVYPELPARFDPPAYQIRGRLSYNAN